MSAPKKWVLREWFVDPTGEGPDEENDHAFSTKEVAVSRAEVLYAAGRSVGVYKRVNVRKPPGTEEVDLPWYAYDWDEIEVWTMPDLPELRIAAISEPKKKRRTR